ncbi:hypothetical protein L1987_74626 [Smallanthus sonchifolius]|uniref:Uncharacterized protein n=1 Tax=Smallanthus sonchifolius TaxID=185202 RepID=A0ACB9A339_9ASTR|nr:hypothetical protein L1987_74626 [Smallanthus sonchifolius]
MAARSSLAGMEVSIIGGDSIKWFNVSDPSTYPPSTDPFAPPTEDASSCCNIGVPPTYFIWEKEKEQQYPTKAQQVEIMKKLPVKSLIQFRSVSKAWQPFNDSSDLSCLPNNHGKSCRKSRDFHIPPQLICVINSPRSDSFRSGNGRSNDGSYECPMVIASDLEMEKVRVKNR